MRPSVKPGFGEGRALRFQGQAHFAGVFVRHVDVELNIAALALRRRIGAQGDDFPGEDGKIGLQVGDPRGIGQSVAAELDQEAALLGRARRGRRANP